MVCTVRSELEFLGKRLRSLLQHRLGGGVRKFHRPVLLDQPQHRLFKIKAETFEILRIQIKIYVFC